MKLKLFAWGGLLMAATLWAGYDIGFQQGNQAVQTRQTTYSLGRNGQSAVNYMSDRVLPGNH